MKRIVIFFIATVIISLNQSAFADIVFNTDFENGLPAQFSGGTLASTEGYSSYGFGSQYYWDDSKEDGAITLNLSDLPQHNTIDLTFHVAIIDTWDGNTHRGGWRWPAPDYFNVSINNEVFHETFDNYEGLWDQSYQGPYLVYNAELARSSGENDSAYIITLTDLSHSADTLTIKWYASGAGWQAGWDESYAIDNVIVSVNPVPIPGAGWLLGSGLLGLLTIRTRKKLLKSDQH